MSSSNFTENGTICPANPFRDRVKCRQEGAKKPGQYTLQFSRRETKDKLRNPVVLTCFASLQLAVNNKGHTTRRLSKFIPPVIRALGIAPCWRDNPNHQVLGFLVREFSVSAEFFSHGRAPYPNFEYERLEHRGTQRVDVAHHCPILHRGKTVRRRHITPGV